MSCLYSPDPTTKHSTRVGTALDGNGIYGHNIDGGCEPTDLDACGGRTGVTPDSGGAAVYYYVITNKAPFALGCFGKKDHFTTVDECRALYPTECGDGDKVTLTTEHGSGEYDLDCPCFDKDGSNVPGQGKPGFLAVAGYEQYTAEATDLYKSNYCTPTSAPSPKTPNLVVFQPDDMAFYWDDAPPVAPNQRAQPLPLTPNIDRIRSEGVHFTRAYTVSPMCAPSRFGVLTGRYPSRGKYGQASSIKCTLDGLSAKVADVTVPNSKLCSTGDATDTTFDKNNNLQRSLKAAGYRTGVVGKWHLGQENAAYWNDYTRAQSMATTTGFDAAEGLYYANMNAGSLNGFSHNPEWVTESARTFVSGAVAAKEPFFLFMNPTMPHAPDVITAFGNRWLTVDGSLVDSGTAAGSDAGSIRNTPQSEGGGAALTSDPVSGMTARATLWSAALASQNNNVVRAKKVLSSMWIDDMLGSLLAHLTNEGVLDDTLILFIMDHGVASKGAVYESGARIAMMARYPNGGFTKGGKVNDLISNIDIAPTFVELATGAAVDSAASSMDGHSFAGLAKAATTGGAALTTTRHAFIEINKDRAIVTPKYKYIKRAVETGGGGCGRAATSGPDPSTSYPAYNSAEQLYDLTTDATEQKNIASDAAFQDTVKAMRLEIECHLKDTDITLAGPTYKDCTTAAVGGSDTGGDTDADAKAAADAAAKAKADGATTTKVTKKKLSGASALKAADLVVAALVTVATLSVGLYSHYWE